MKRNLFYFIALCILFCGCNADKSSKTDNGKQSTDAIHPARGKFEVHGLENLNASGILKDIICQCWEFKEDAADDAGSDPHSKIERVYRGYCLFSDGTMIKDPRGNMTTGKWTMNENEKPVSLRFFLSNNETEVYKLAYLMPYQMKLAKRAGDKNLIIDLGSEAVRFTNIANDPFYITNNSWRFKPAKKESNSALKQRLKNCIHFFVLFYDQKINTGSDFVSFTGLPSCFKWYGGGIYLQKEKELQAKWVNTFYNKEQAMFAYKLAGVLLEQKYIWPEKETNWLKLNVAVLKQMEQKIDSL